MGIIVWICAGVSHDGRKHSVGEVKERTRRTARSAIEAFEAAQAVFEGSHFDFS
jgi:hypothetical protein